VESSGVLAVVTDSNLWSGQVCVWATIGLAEQVICLSSAYDPLWSQLQTYRGCTLGCPQTCTPSKSGYDLPAAGAWFWCHTHTTHTVSGFVVARAVQLEVDELTSFRRHNDVVIYIGVMCKLGTVSRFTCSWLQHVRDV